MEINNVSATCAAIEAILFASGEPIEVSKIASAVDVKEEVVYKLIKTLQDKYDKETSGISLVELNDSFQFCTKSEYADYVKKALEMRRNVPLSNAAMEILAIIAYNQPVTKSFIEQIRGVDSSQTVNSLVQKGLVEEAGRLEMPGRPISYRTTSGFLRNFGIKSIDELPPIPDENENEKVFIEDFVKNDK